MLRVTTHLILTAMWPICALAETIPAVQVRDSLILSATEVDGLKISELSGLAYDADDGALYAVSDKSRLFRFALDVTGDRFARLEPVSGATLTDAAGQPMREAGFNPEGLEARDAANGTTGDTRLILLSEEGPRAAEFSANGQWRADLPLPPSVTDPTALRSDTDGVEAITRHPVHGLITAPQEPLLGSERTLHTLYATDGRAFSYTSDDIGKSGIKGLTTLADGRILVLERTRSADRLTLTPYLRLLDPEACRVDGPCPTTVQRIDVPGITDADYEGIAEIAPDLFVIVSDDDIEGTRRTVFALVRLVAK
jgi:hypothetical protein